MLFNFAGILNGVCGDVHEYLHFPPCWDCGKESGIDIGVIWSDKVFAVFTIHYASIPRLWTVHGDTTHFDRGIQKQMFLHQ